MRITATYIDNGILDTVNIDTNFIEQHGKKFKIGDSLVSTDVDCPEFHKYVTPTGFFNTSKVTIFLTAEGFYLYEDSYRLAKSHESVKSKYPDTSVLREYLNAPCKLAGKLPNHLHIDDFVRDYDGRLCIYENKSTKSYFLNDMNRGSYIDVNYTGGRHGFKILSFDDRYDSTYHSDHPYKNYRPMYGEQMKMFQFVPNHVDFNLFVRNPSCYDERNPVYVIRKDPEYVYNYGGAELWDPVSDIVRVERITGNDTFVSGFGYICSIEMYALITNGRYSRWRLGGL